MKGIKVLIVFLFAAIAFTLGACVPTPGIDTAYFMRLQNFEEIEIVFGSEFLYPDDQNANGFEVNFMPPINGEATLKHYPEATEAFWKTKIAEIETLASIGKMNEDFRLENYYDNTTESYQQYRIGDYEVYERIGESGFIFQFQSNNALYDLTIRYPDDFTDKTDGEREAWFSIARIEAKRYIENWIL